MLNKSIKNYINKYKCDIGIHNVYILNQYIWLLTIYTCLIFIYDVFYKFMIMYSCIYEDLNLLITYIIDNEHRA